MEAEALSQKCGADEGIEPKSIYARRAFGASNVNWRRRNVKETKGVGFGWRKPRPKLIRQSGHGGVEEFLLAEGFDEPVHWLLDRKV
jgi:hypothetical protein